MRNEIFNADRSIRVSDCAIRVSPSQVYFYDKISAQHLVFIHQHQLVFVAPNLLARLSTALR